MGLCRQQVHKKPVYLSQNTKQFIYSLHVIVHHSLAAFFTARSATLGRFASTICRKRDPGLLFTKRKLEVVSYVRLATVNSSPGLAGAYGCQGGSTNSEVRNGTVPTNILNRCPNYQVIWQKAASPCCHQSRRVRCRWAGTFARRTMHNAHVCYNGPAYVLSKVPPSNIGFLRLPRVCPPHGISIGSAIIAQLTRVPNIRENFICHRHTMHTNQNT